MSEKTNRTFLCKRCAQTVTEPYATWKKKPQKDKRICESCRRKREIARQDAAERARYAGYSVDIYRL